MNKLNKIMYVRLYWFVAKWLFFYSNFVDVVNFELIDFEIGVAPTQFKFLIFTFDYDEIVNLLCQLQKKTHIPNTTVEWSIDHQNSINETSYQNSIAEFQIVCHWTNKWMKQMSE